MSELIDTQNSLDGRNIAINRVGIKDFKLPVQLTLTNGVQNSIANVNMYVYLSGQYRGTHMSRFITLISENKKPIDCNTLKILALHMCEKLEANEGEIELQSTIFLKKIAPISQISSWMDYPIIYKTCVSQDGVKQFLKVKVPTTSLCPCSKEISNYGAHNQRSIITITVQYKQSVSPEELIKIAEKSASSELYSILKRSDEKYVTEKAYDNPKFVEDIVREIYQTLKNHPNFIKFKIESENFESIHNHSAYAEIIA